MDRDAILAELREIEGIPLDDEDRHALYGAQQALRNVLDGSTWHRASQTFYRIDDRPSEAASLRVH
jgi:hypothetical protein